MELPIYQVDAFASALFRGNPAAVCPLEGWLPGEILQAIAAENNLAETAYYVRRGERYDLRWFTPTVEVDLCGHATLAAASVILDVGELAVEREGDLYALDFPSRPAAPCPPQPQLELGLGAKPSQVLAAQDYLCIFETEEQVRELDPDMRELAGIELRGTIATAPGRDCDFVSRFFAPGKGIPEDPVTGSAHSTLIPYWSKRLGKSKLFARQISKRGGELWCQDRGARVRIAGAAAQYLEGRIKVPVTDLA
jgi:predicted PhzF superfamily epimerase YddE/YHI9